MIIEVRKLNSRNKYYGEFSYEYDAPASLIAVPLFEFAGPVKVDGSYAINEDDSVDVALTVRFRLTGSCSYCLEHAEKDISYNYDALFCAEDDADGYRYNGISADITPAVNDAILFSQPSVILCREGCKGIDLNNDKIKEV